MEVGLLVAAENTTEISTFEVMIDAADSVGFVSSRGALITQDRLAPRGKALLNVITIDLSKPGGEGRMAYSAAARFSAPGETSRLYPPAGELTSLHLPVPDVKAARLRQLTALYLDQGVSREAAETLAVEDISQ
jgi:hypothetical protein